MPQLLLELFSEEIPARMQAQAARDLERLIVGALTDRGSRPKARAALHAASPRRSRSKVFPPSRPTCAKRTKGPRVDAPEQAIEGFLRSTGLTRDQCKSAPTRRATSTSR